MDVRSVFSTIFRQIWKFLLIAVPIVLIAVLYVLTATPVYTSQTKLLVKFGQDARPDMALSQSIGLSAEERRGLVQANVNILLSRDLVQELLKKTGVEKVYPSIAKKYKDPNRVMNVAVTQFLKDMKIVTESNAGSIDVSLQNKNPEIAKVLLNDLLDLFIQRQSEIFGNPQAEVIREQAESAYKQLEQANQDLFAYKEKVGVASIDEEMTLLLNKRSDIAEYLSRQDRQGGEARISENMDEASVDESAPAVSGKISVLPLKVGENNNAIPFPALDEIQARIDDLRSKELELLRTYKPSSQNVVSIRKNIAAETSVLNTAVKSLYDKLDQLDARIAEMNKYKSEYDILQRKAQFTEEIYKTAQTRLQAAEVNNDLNQRKITQISVLQNPTLPDKPAEPKKLLIVVLSIIAATMFGIGACLISELMDTRFSSPEQLSAHLKEPLLASFSRKKIYANGTAQTASYWEESLKKYKAFVAKLAKRDLPEEVKQSGVVERKILSVTSMGTLFQSVASQMTGSDKKIIYVTSSYEGEGSTTIAWELSRYITEVIKKNVLFIDYSEQRGPTLLDVARAKARVEDAVVKLTHGEGQLSVARLADNEDRSSVVAYINELSKLISSLKAGYDYIIIPTSNVMVEASHLSLSSLADGTLFVIEADRTRAPVAKQALQSLKNSGAKVVGVILNKRFYYIPKWLYSHL